MSLLISPWISHQNPPFSMVKSKQIRMFDSYSYSSITIYSPLFPFYSHSIPMSHGGFPSYGIWGYPPSGTPVRSHWLRSWPFLWSFVHDMARKSPYLLELNNIYIYNYIYLHTWYYLYKIKVYIYLYNLKSYKVFIAK